METRWCAGYIEDSDLDDYLSHLTIIFHNWADIQVHNKKAQLFKDHLSDLKLRHSTPLKEILMTILHFSQYSIKDAIRLAQQNFVNILDKLTTFESLQAHKLI